MNKLTAIAALSGAALVLCCAAACNKAETPAPEVKVTVAGVTMNSVSFTVSATNAAECSYLVVGADETVPAASAILADGTSVDLANASEIVAEGLEPSTEYTVAVAVSSEDGKTAVATANATTEADPAIVLDSATGRHYGSGSNWSMTLRGEADGMEYEMTSPSMPDMSPRESIPSLPTEVTEPSARITVLSTFWIRPTTRTITILFLPAPWRSR